MHVRHAFPGIAGIACDYHASTAKTILPFLWGFPASISCARRIGERQHLADLRGGPAGVEQAGRDDQKRSLNSSSEKLDAYCKISD